VGGGQRMNLRPLGTEFRVVTFVQNTTNPGRWVMVYRVVEHVETALSLGPEGPSRVAERLESVSQEFTSGLLWRDYCCDGLEKFAEMKDGRVTFQHARPDNELAAPSQEG